MVHMCLKYKFSPKLKNPTLLNRYYVSPNNMKHAINLKEEMFSQLCQPYQARNNDS